MSEGQTVTVPHLGGSRIGCRFGRPHDPSLPTLVLVNSFATSAELYRPQFEDTALGDAANLLAIELYGHGGTRTSFEQFTYWDTALANLQVLDVLDIAEAFVLGTSQGGWVAARMAMLEPTRVRGIVPLGTSMDHESPRSRDLGCWDAAEACTPLIDGLSEPVGPDWTVDEAFCDFILGAGIGGAASPEERERWHAMLKASYRGDDGRKRLRMCAINLRDRDGLYGRLDAVACPVLWMHGTADQVYSVANAEAEVAMFAGAAEAELRVVEGGQHFLSASDPEAVDQATVEFIGRWA